MRKLLPLLSILLLAIAASAQSTYTSTLDGCGGKNLGYCRLNVVNQNSQPFTAILDTRYTAGGPLNTLAIETLPWPGTTVLKVHGVYSGFVANPNGTRQPYYGAGSFLSDDGKVEGSFLFYAFYIATCSGRGCYGTYVGWHYRVLVGSTITTP